MPATRKRARQASGVSQPPSAPSGSGSPTAPRDPSDTDSFLCRLGSSTAASLSAVHESAETARSSLMTAKASVLAAVEARFSELEAAIAATEASQTITLEHSLVAVDAVLVLWREKCGAILPRSAHEGLDARIAGLADDAAPPHLSLKVDTPALLRFLSQYGCVVAPPPIAPGDVNLGAISPWIRPGDPLRLRWTLSAAHGDKSPEELRVSLSHLSSSLCPWLHATVHRDGVPRTESLAPAVACNAVKRCIDVTFVVPPSTPVGASILLYATPPSLSCAALFALLPTTVRVTHGIRSELRIPETVSANYAPSISFDGKLYVPMGEAPALRVFAADGHALPRLKLGSVGLTNFTRWSALGGTQAQTLFLADSDGVSSRLVAMSSTKPHTVLWSKAIGSYCAGIAASQACGLIWTLSSNMLEAHAMLDGSLVFASASEAMLHWLAFDDASGSLFSSSMEGSSHCVSAWSWKPGCGPGGSGALLSLGPVLAAGRMPMPRACAVMPAAPGKETSHLIVIAYTTPLIRVLELPGLTLVHEHVLEDAQLIGLAADPWGAALAVCDGTTNSIVVMAWPLPGMLPLM